MRLVMRLHRRLFPYVSSQPLSGAKRTFREARQNRIYEYAHLVITYFSEHSPSLSMLGCQCFHCFSIIQAFRGSGREALGELLVPGTYCFERKGHQARCICA